MIVANDVTDEDSGFDVDTNTATILDQSGATDSLPLMSKEDLADRIYDHFIALRNRKTKVPMLHSR